MRGAPIVEKEVAMSEKFGNLLKTHRMALGLSLREFCLKHSLDAGNHSRLERGMYPPPESSEKLAVLARALGLIEGSDKWMELFDVASVERGEIPCDLMNDEELVEKLPVFFRTLRAAPIDGEALDRLIDQIRRT